MKAGDLVMVTPHFAQSIGKEPLKHTIVIQSARTGIILRGPVNWGFYDVMLHNGTKIHTGNRNLIPIEEYKKTLDKSP